MSPGHAERGPGQAPAAINASATKQDGMRVPASRPTVIVTERVATASVTVPDPAADALLRRTVAAHRRERRGRREWMVYRSQVGRLVAAFDAAGYTVERVTA